MVCYLDVLFLQTTWLFPKLQLENFLLKLSLSYLPIFVFSYLRNYNYLCNKKSTLLVHVHLTHTVLTRFMTRKKNQEIIWLRKTFQDWDGMALTPFPSSIGEIRTHDNFLVNLTKHWTLLIFPQIFFCGPIFLLKTVQRICVFTSSASQAFLILREKYSKWDSRIETIDSLSGFTDLELKTTTCLFSYI